jgi:hypothetical protein
MPDMNVALELDMSNGQAARHIEEILNGRKLSELCWDDRLKIDRIIRQHIIDRWADPRTGNSMMFWLGGIWYD